MQQHLFLVSSGLVYNTRQQQQLHTRVQRITTHGVCSFIRFQDAPLSLSVINCYILGTTLQNTYINHTKNTRIHMRRVLRQRQCVGDTYVPSSSSATRSDTEHKAKTYKTNRMLDWAEAEV